MLMFNIIGGQYIPENLAPLLPGYSLISPFYDRKIQYTSQPNPTESNITTFTPDTSTLSKSKLFYNKNTVYVRKEKTKPFEEKIDIIWVDSGYEGSILHSIVPVGDHHFEGTMSIDAFEGILSGNSLNYRLDDSSYLFNISKTLYSYHNN